MSQDKPVAFWVWPVMVGAWVGFLSEMEFVRFRLSFPFRAITGVATLAVSVYALRHCWTNPKLAFRTRINWMAAIFMTWILGATGYLLWWQCDASTRVQPAITAIGGEPANGGRLQRLTSPKWVEFVRVNIMVAWVCVGVIFILFLRGSFLVSTEVLIPLFTGLATSAIAMIWAVRVIEGLGQEMGDSERLAWIIIIVSTWVLGATLAWLTIRARASEADAS